MANTGNKMTTISAIKADTHRQYGQFSWLNLLKGVLTRRTFRLIVTLRFCQCIAKSSIRWFLLPIFKLLHRLAAHSAGIDLSWQTSIGAGFAITHGWGMVVNTEAVIGNNVTLFHGVTLGCRDRIAPDGQRKTEYPVIEDEVWIGPHAIIVGGVTIGRGCRIAGGAFITESIPPYSVVSGNPASIIKSGCTPDVVNPVEL